MGEGKVRVAVRVKLCLGPLVVGVEVYLLTLTPIGVIKYCHQFHESTRGRGSRAAVRFLKCLLFIRPLYIAFSYEAVRNQHYQVK